MASKKYLGSLYAVLGIDTDDWDKSLARINRNLRSMGNQFEQFGLRANAMISLPLGLALKSSLDKFQEFQTAFAGIRKTVTVPKDVNEETFFGALEIEIRNLSKTMPQSAAQLSLIGEMAGQLGVASQDLVPFIKTMAMLGDTTNLASNDAAIAMAKFTNVIGFPRQEIEKLSDSLVTLGNKTSTFESDILMMSTRMASAGKNAGLTGQEIFAVAAAMSSLGEEAEVGGTSMSKLFRNINDTAIYGGEKLTALNKIVGEDFKKAWQTDASGALVKFAQGLEMVREKEGSLTATMKNLGINNSLQITSVEKLASGHKILAEAIEISNNSYGNGATALEASKRYATFESQLKILKNNIDDVAIGMGAKLAPQVLYFTGVVKGLAQGFDAFPEKLKDFVLYFGEILAIVPPLALGFGLLSKSFGIIGVESVLMGTLVVGALAGIIAFGPTLRDYFTDVREVIRVTFEDLDIAIANAAIEAWNTAKQYIADGINFISEGVAGLSNYIAKLFGKTGGAVATPFAFAKTELLEYNKENEKIIQNINNKWAGGLDGLGKKGASTWASLSSGASAAADRFKAWVSQYEPAEKGEKKLSKAQKERLKTLEKINEQAKKATEYLDDQLEGIDKKIKEANIQKSVEEAFKTGNTEALDQWKKDLEIATREGIEKTFLDKGGQFPLTKEDAEKIGKLAELEAETTWETWKDKFTKQGTDGLMGEFPNYLSRTITESILSGFEDGFSSESLKGFGTSISSIFAQAFQDSFKDLFKAGGFSMEALGESFANLGIAYGVQSLTANLSDNEKDVQGGIIGGAVLGASLGSAFGPWGTAIGAVVGGAGGALAGSLGPSTNSNTANRHDTATYIENLLKDKGGSLSFLKDGWNIQEGGDTRFNTTDSGSFMQSLGEGIVDAYAYYYAGGLYGAHVDTGGQTAHSVGADALASPKPEVGSIQGPGWADQYWAQFGQAGGESFGALGAAFSEMAGTMGPQMEQMGVLIAENLGGNLDNARVLLQTLDISAEDLATSFLNIGLSGQESWHQVEIYMQRIPELTGEGLVAFADLAGAMQRFRESAGTGKQSLIDLKNVMAEAREAGVEDFSDLREALIAQGVAVEDVDRFITAMGQRGITTMEQFASASDRDLGGVVADMESLGFQWENVGDGIEEADRNIKNLGEKLQTLKDTEVDVKVNINYNEENKPKILEGNSSFDLSSSSSSSATQKRSLINLPTIDESASSNSVVVNVDARGSEAGVERKITAAILASQKQIIQGSVSAIQQMRRRGAF